MRKNLKSSAAVVLVRTFTIGGAVLAQSVLMQLGLTEVAARNFLLDEIKSPASSRRSAIAVAGDRAFLKLPPAARATSLFAWAKAYVNSPAFETSYASYRSGVIGEPRQHARTVEEEVKQQMDDALAGLEQI